MSNDLIDEVLRGVSLERIEVVDQFHIIGFTRLSHDIGDVDLWRLTLQDTPADSLDQ